MGKIRICIRHKSNTCTTIINIFHIIVTIGYYNNIQDVGIYYNKLLIADL